jgi:inhibitor of cysteine peptidase
MSAPTAKEPGLLTVDESSGGRTVELAVGGQMEIRLEENRTTGFRWEPATDAGTCAACTPAGDSFTPSASGAGAPGQGGTHAWRFKAVQAGDCTLAFDYRRSWEGEGAAARTFRLHVHVS